jgi:hypothetical protein
VPTDVPTILATSGGLRDGVRTRWEFSPLTDLAVELAGVTGRAPRICFLATAQGDNPAAIHGLTEAAQLRGFAATHVSLVPMPNVADVEGHLLAQDVVWVCGGSVAALLALWRLHGVDRAMHSAWAAGRRPLFQRLVAERALDAGYATDDGVGVLYRGTEFVEAVSEIDGAGAYFVAADGQGGVTETRLDTRRL